MRGLGTNSHYETVYSLILDSISIPQEVDEEYGKAIGQILWDYYENNNSQDISWQSGSDSSALKSKVSSEKRVQLYLETLSEVYIKFYEELVKSFEQDLPQISSVLNKLSAFTSQAQPNQDDAKVKNALEDLVKIVTLQNNQNMKSFLGIYLELKTIEKSKPGTFTQALDEFRTALASLRIYDVLLGINQYIEEQDKNKILTSALSQNI